MTPEITALVQLIGAPAAIVLVLIFRDWIAGRASAKQDDAVTDFAVTFNAERKQLQESNNTLQSEVFQIRLDQAREAGRREEMRITNDKNEAKIVTLEVRIQELEKYQQQSKARIQELEAEIIILNKKLTEANAEISLLQAQKHELESLLKKETNRANSLNSLVAMYQKEAATDANTQAIPDMDDTVIRPPDPVPPEPLADDDAA